MKHNNTSRISPDIDAPLSAALDEVIQKCSACGACQTKCRFLQIHGLPKAIAEAYDPASNALLAYECSLCGLCGAVCPERLDPTLLFLAMRRNAAGTGRMDFSHYKTILGYEKRGNSPLFSYYGLPEGCDTIFFPGCTLTGTRPETTHRIFTHLRNSIPNVGIVLDCCNKISHDLGRQHHFITMFDEMRRFLTSHHVHNVLAACPNCYDVFHEYGKGLRVETIYEHLSRNGLPAHQPFFGQVTLHDPCPLRMEEGIHKAVRDVAVKLGFSIREMKHKRNRTVCCGEGGSVGFWKSEFANEWTRLRKTEAGDLPILTYCAGCAGFLGRKLRTFHIADALFSPQDCINGNVKVVKAPFTYLKRLQLKRRFKRELKPAVSRSRSAP